MKETVTNDTSIFFNIFVTHRKDNDNDNDNENYISLLKISTQHVYNGSSMTIRCLKGTYLVCIHYDELARPIENQTSFFATRN